MSKTYNVPVNIDIEVEADDSEQAWELVYERINGQLIDLVEKNFAGADLVIEVGEPYDTEG